jgi:hypothetical protein
MEAAKATAPDAAKNRRRVPAVFWCGVGVDVRGKAFMLHLLPQ